MHGYDFVIPSCWLVFLIVWIVTAFSAKPSLNRGRTWWRQGVVRLGIVLVLFLVLRLLSVRHQLGGMRPLLTNHNPALGIAGDMLCIAGVGLAIWARLILGRNWGMPMTRKQNPALVTAGPYAVIRHPIYTGMLIAMFGTIMGGSILVLLPLVIVGGYFLYSARREEKLMLEQFPASYPAYKARTWMLLPFIL